MTGTPSKRAGTSRPCALAALGVAVAGSFEGLGADRQLGADARPVVDDAAAHWVDVEVDGSEVGAVRVRFEQSRAEGEVAEPPVGMASDHGVVGAWREGSEQLEDLAVRVAAGKGSVVGSTAGAACVHQCDEDVGAQRAQLVGGAPGLLGHVGEAHARDVDRIRHRRRGGREQADQADLDALALHHGEPPLGEEGEGFVAGEPVDVSGQEREVSLACPGGEGAERIVARVERRGARP